MRPRLWIPALLLTPAVAAAGCGGSNASTTGRPGQVEFDLASKNDTNTTGGRAILTYESKSRTRLRVDGIDEGEPAGGGPNPVLLVRGTCDSTKDVVARLPALEGSRTSRTVPIGLTALFAGDYAVEVMLSRNQPQTIACGEVPSSAPTSGG